ncbi:MAG: CRISPR-associated endonuclease Cas2 [Myxococcales bacterium]|nr:CRISPR-associated endonuclease Cas2 [Myxococcales bacterium]
MSERSVYVVSYDICEPGRLRKVHALLRGYGDAVQYSVFLCELSKRERVELQDKLEQRIHHREDQVLFVDVGPVAGRGALAISSLGRATPRSERGPVVL